MAAKKKKSGGGRKATPGLRAAQATPSKGLAPRIGFEAVGRRLATVWGQNPEDLHPKGVTGAGIVAALDKADALVDTEEKARKAYLAAATYYGGVHDERVGHVKGAWRDFLVALDHLRAAAKHDPEVAERYRFIFDFMAAKKPKKGPPKS